MMASREVNLLRKDIHSWHQSVKTVAPIISKYVIGTAFDDPGILDSFADLVDDVSKCKAPLEALLRRDPLEVEVAEWIALIKSCSAAAVAKRKRTCRALDDPSWRGIVRTDDDETKLIRNCQEALGNLGIPNSVLGKWVVPSKRRKDADAGKQQEERKRLLLEVTELIMSLKFPLSHQLQGSSVPDTLISRLAGGKRLSTIKKHVRTIRLLVRWSNAVLQRSLPYDWTGYALYLEDLAKEPCGPSVPRSILKAVDFLEMVGGVKESIRIGRDSNLVQIANDITIELKSGNTRGKKKSPPQAFAALVSSEVAIMDSTAPVYTRLFHWTKLIKHWAALRWDDTMHTPPRLARMTVEGLTLVVTQTKTTGPGKKVETIYAYVSAEAYFYAPDWLSCGWRLFQELGQKDREYWLPLPDRSLEGFSDRAPRYGDALTMARQEMKELTAVWATQGANGVIFDFLMDSEGMPEPLFEPCMQLFWKLHGDRATIVNWALVLGFDKEVRQFLGRWSPSASDEYIRVQKFVTMKTQKEISARIRRGDLQDSGFLGEVDTWDELARWAESNQFLPEVVDRQVRKLRSAFVGAAEWREPSLDPNVLPLPATKPGTTEEDDDGFTVVHAGGLALISGDVDKIAAVPVDPVDLPALDTDTEVEEANPAGLSSGTFVVSHKSSGKARTLHRVGRCWRKPGVHYRSFTVLESMHSIEDVTIGAFERICKDCYPREVASSSAGDVPTLSLIRFEESESSSSSSSSDSD